MGKDFATGKHVDLKKPEERVRQDYEKILHEDYGYPLERMKTEVPIKMGSSRRFCDIAVYDKQGNIIGIVETKAPKIAAKDGKEQLKSYISATATCRWGVWTDGVEMECARRNPKTQEIQFSPAFTVPRVDEQDVEIKDFDRLIPASNLKWIFRRINNRLYANTNLPRTEKQGAEMVRLIFCKLTDEYNIRRTKQSPNFQVMINEQPNQTRRRIQKLWEDTKKKQTATAIFSDDEKITIDDYSLQLIVSSLQEYSLLKTNRDVVGDAFEVFSERQFAGDKGQFFTPRAVVRMVIEMIDPKQHESIIDPACGSGGFLIAALNHITQEVKDENEKRDIAERCLYGIDKDNDLSKICRAHMSIIGDGKSNIVTADSLKSPLEWDNAAKSKLLVDGELKQFDVVITNPPFGSKIKVIQDRVLEQYDLSRNKPTPPQVLFIERCLDMLKPGGRLGIVLPDGLLGNPTDGYIRSWLAKRARVLAVVDCPTATFMPHTGTKTSVLIAQKNPASADKVFFAIAENCGHSFRGVDVKNPDGTLREDFSTIASHYNDGTRGDHLGFRQPTENWQSAKNRSILVPRYYDPRIVREIRALEAKDKNGLQMISVDELCEQGIISLNGIPASASSEEYDLHGEVRFIRTSDIAGFELYERTQKMVSKETWLAYQDKQDMQIGDILFVKDGDNKIGETAILLDEDDRQILVQTHFKKFRAHEISAFFLLWMLNQKIVKKQIRQRVFNQSTLSTIGDRIRDLRLPMLIDKKRRLQVEKEVKRLTILRRKSLRELREQLRHHTPS